MNPDTKRPLIGVIMSTFVNPFHTTLFRGLSDRAGELDVNLLGITGSSLKSDNQEHLMRNILYELVDPGLFDGFVIPLGSLSRFVGTATYLDYIKGWLSKPAVSVIGDKIPGKPRITPDYTAGISSLLDHLTQVHGCRRIAMIRGEKSNKSSNIREEAYRSYLGQYKLPFREEWIYSGSLDYSLGGKAVGWFFDNQKYKFDAIITTHDRTAIGALKELAQRKIAVPGELIVCGFQGISEGMFCFPSLTTMAESSYNLGQEAMSTLVKMIRGEMVGQEIFTPCELIKRQSCGCVKKSSDSLLDLETISQMAQDFMELSETIKKECSSRGFFQLV